MNYYSLSGPVKNAQVDQGGRHVAVTKQLLDGPDIVSRLEQAGECTKPHKCVIAMEEIDHGGES
jgi:hypothetical protein